MILFSGERPPLDNFKMGQNLNAPRNLGLVITSSDFQNILSVGESSSGGFYSSGIWRNLTNEGIVWITDFTPNASKEDLENAIWVKTAKF